MAPVSQGRETGEAWRKGGKGRRGVRPGGPQQEHPPHRAPAGVWGGRAAVHASPGMPLGQGRAGSASSSGPHPPDPRLGRAAFGRAAPLRLLSAAAAGRLPRSSPPSAALLRARHTGSRRRTRCSQHGRHHRRSSALSAGSSRKHPKRLGKREGGAPSPPSHRLLVNSGNTRRR